MSAADPATRWPVKLKGTIMSLHAALDDTYGDGNDEYHGDEEELSDRIGAEATDAAFIVANQQSTDTNIVNAIALMLGTHREWNGADFLEAIANLISLVREHPGRPGPRRIRHPVANRTPIQIAPNPDHPTRGCE